MLEPVAVIDVVSVEQLGKGMDGAHLGRILVLDEGAAVEGHGARYGGRRARRGRLSGQLGHVVQRRLVG